MCNAFFCTRDLAPEGRFFDSGLNALILLSFSTVSEPHSVGGLREVGKVFEGPEITRGKIKRQVMRGAQALQLEHKGTVEPHKTYRLIRVSSHCHLAGFLSECLYNLCALVTSSMPEIPTREAGIDPNFYLHRL